MTKNEMKALKAIVESEYQNGGNPVDHDVWTEYCNPFGSKRTFSGVMSSLSKKGYVYISDMDMGTGLGKMGTVAITQAGFNAYKKG